LQTIVPCSTKEHVVGNIGATHLLQNNFDSTAALYIGFAAVWGGSWLLANNNLEMHRVALGRPGGSQARRLRAVTVIWFSAATVLALVAFLRPDVRLPPPVIPALVATLAVLYAVLLWRTARGQQPPTAKQALQSWNAGVGLQRWRAYFGALILLGAALGNLPWSFALAAGVGDVAVGLWAAWLQRRGTLQLIEPSLAHKLAFTTFGVADLVNAGRLGGAVVVPWLLERQLPVFLLMLPLFGVPILLVTHFWMLRCALGSRDGSSAATSS
jgi:hypothetical protein